MVRAKRHAKKTTDEPGRYQPPSGIRNREVARLARRYLLLALAPIAIVGCATTSASAPAATVTVTATAAPSTITATPAPESSTTTPSERREDDDGLESSSTTSNSYQREPLPPNGVIAANAEKICVPPVATLPDLVNNGDSPEFVDALQLAMFVLGYEITFSSSYDAETVRVVKLMQEDLGVVPDGQVGPITWGALRDRHCPEWERYFTNQSVVGAVYSVRYAATGYAVVQGSYSTTLGSHSGQWAVRDEWAKTIEMESGNSAFLSLYYDPRSSYHRTIRCQIFVNGVLEAESTASVGNTAYCEVFLP